MSNLKFFESKKIRSEWNVEEDKWYFSIVDIVEILTDSTNPQVYWRVLKNGFSQKEMKPLQIVTV